MCVCVGHKAFQVSVLKLCVCVGGGGGGGVSPQSEGLQAADLNTTSAVQAMGRWCSVFFVWGGGAGC